MSHQQRPLSAAPRRWFCTAGKLHGSSTFPSFLGEVCCWLVELALAGTAVSLSLSLSLSRSRRWWQAGATTAASRRVKEGDRTRTD